MMPIRDRATALGALAANPDHSSIPVSDQCIPEEAVKQQCSGYNLLLRKPYKIGPFLNAIITLLKKVADTAGDNESNPKDQ
jgi:hypothetical protein